MITSVCFLILVATVPLLGGKLSRLAEVRLNAWWTIVASLIIQVFLIEVFAGSFGGALSATIHLLSYALAIMFVWHNRHVVGMGVMVFGGLLNLAAIAANGGVMPAQLEALEGAGIITDSPEFENSAPVEDARLAFLGDIFWIPEGVPFANVFSIGDIILVLGGGITVHTIGRSRLGTAITRRTDQLGRRGDEPNTEDGSVSAPAGTAGPDETAATATGQTDLAELRAKAAAFDELEAMARSVETSPEAVAHQIALAGLLDERRQLEETCEELRSAHGSLRAELQELEKMRASYHRELRRLDDERKAAQPGASSLQR